MNPFNMKCPRCGFGNLIAQPDGEFARCDSCRYRFTAYDLVRNRPAGEPPRHGIFSKAFELL